MSTETDFNSKEVEILSPENDLGEQTFSGIAQNIHLEVSKLYQEKLVTAKSENDIPFSLLGETEGDPPCPRPVLMHMRVFSLSLESLWDLLFVWEGPRDQCQVACQAGLAF